MVFGYIFWNYNFETDFQLECYLNRYFILLVITASFPHHNVIFSKHILHIIFFLCRKPFVHNQCTCDLYPSINSSPIIHSFPLKVNHMYHTEQIPNRKNRITHILIVNLCQEYSIKHIIMLFNSDYFIQSYGTQSQNIMVHNRLNQRKHSTKELTLEIHWDHYWTLTTHVECNIRML